MNKAFFNWSGGKDSALALFKVLQNQQYNVGGLLTTISEEHKRITMHGVREELLECQAQALKLPLQKVYIAATTGMEEYESKMNEALSHFKNQGMHSAIFGDIFLEDLKKYREDKLREVELKAHFPLWQKNTTELLHEFIDLGFKTVVVCVNGDLLPKEFAGRTIDKDFIKDLPEGVDLCGENGEFHTFVYEAPMFDKPIPIAVGDHSYQEYDNPSGGKVGFWFRDIELKR